MKQHEILTAIQSLDVKHSSLFSDYMECEGEEKEKELYTEMIVLEKQAKELLKQLN